ncbi:MAG TPA: hypothetical protein VFD32_08435, partial [Dehalococcoidia bacterium]|nr:hypothetical protein [Dehalococcoidia bacterium]
RVDIVRTALDDLKGMARMAKRSMTGRIAIPELSRQPGRAGLRGMGRRWRAPGSAALAAISALAVVTLTFKAGG